MGRSVISKAMATCAVTMLALGASVFVASVPAGAALFGVSVLKDCTTPINVGDAYSCEFEISNTVQTSQNTVTVDQLTDVVQASGGAQTAVTPINNTTPGLIFTGGASCGATNCTIPFGGSVTTPFISHYTSQFADFPTLSDQGTFRWQNKCDVVSNGCNTGNANGQANAQATINPLSTSVVTAIHDAAHQTVTSVAVGSTVHDFVTVNGQQNQPNPTGNVNIDWFLNGTCDGPPAQNSGSVGPLDANGQFDATAFNFTVNTPGQRAFLAHYEGAGAYLPSTGVCEPLNVVDANIQISPLTATNKVGDNHILTGHVNVNAGLGFVNAPDGTVINFSILSGPGSFVGPNSCTTAGGTGSCQVTISSAVTGQTVIRATTDVTVSGVSLHRETGDGHAGDSADAGKTWVNAQISIAPNATNEVGQPHTFTVTLEKDTGTGVFVPAAGEHVDVTLTDSNGAAHTAPTGTCTNAGANTDALGQCTITFTSPTAGKVTGHASSTLNIGVASVHVETDGANGNSGDAVKTFVDANIQISPNGTNRIGASHTFTAHVNVNDGNGFVNAPDGTQISFTIDGG